MSDPVRLYNPNPDAPDVWGAPPTKRNRLVEALASIPSPFEVFAPPPAARQAYGSLARAIVDSTAPAAVRDTVDASGQTMDALRQGRGWDAAGGVAGMLTAAAGVVPGGKLLVKGAKAANPIRAYHGSPHDFDRFDMSKIGTGEGAQAYGHGLYFAENEAVARGYRDVLAKGYESTDGPLTRDIQSALEYVHPKFKASGDIEGGIRDAIVRMKDQAEFYRKQYGPGPNLYDSAVERLSSINPASLKPSGRMYEVNIHADPAKFLDWDKPLSAQSSTTRDAVMSMPEVQNSLLVRSKILGDKALDPVGQQAYADLTGWKRGVDLSPHADAAVVAAQRLRDAGIPGIKYLDGGSRSAGDGSRNYVAFDDKLIEILRKYGLLPVAAGGAAVAAGGSTSDEGGF